MPLFPLFCSPKVERIGRVTVIYGPKIGPPPFCHLLQIPWFIAFAKSRLKLNQGSTGLIYNYGFTQISIIAGLKLIFGCSFIMDLEELTYSHTLDILRLDRRFCRRVVHGLEQWIGLRLIKGAVVPASGIGQGVPANIPVLTCQGCIPVAPQVPPVLQDQQVTMLWAAPIVRERGIDIFAQVLKILDSADIYKEIATRLVFQVCGVGSESRWFQANTKTFKLIKCNYLGFVSESEYSKILSSVDVCLSLQPNLDKDASLTMPSKVPEFMAAGKVVIASSIGDINKLPSNVILRYEDDNPAKIARLCASVAMDTSKHRDLAKEAHKYAAEHFSALKVGLQLLRFFSQVR